MNSVIQALKLSYAEWQVRRKAKRIALKMYGKGKFAMGQRERYVRGQVALWEEMRHESY